MMPSRSGHSATPGGKREGDAAASPMAMFRSFFHVLLPAGLFFATPLEADTFVVSSPIDGGPGSLRNAVAQAEANPGPDTIVFDAALSGTIIDLDSQIEVASPDGLVVTAEGLTDEVSVSGFFGECRIFKVEAGASLELVDLILMDGYAPAGITGTDGESPTAGTDGGNGGAIHNEGILVLRRCIVEWSVAGDGGRGGHKTGVTEGSSGQGGAGGKGGGIYSEGVDALVRLVDSIVRLNVGGVGGAAGNLVTGSSGSIGAAGTGGPGGGIHCAGGALEIVDSTIDSNTAGSGGDGGANGNAGAGGRGGRGGDGGGIVIDGAAISIVDSTIRNNTAGYGRLGGESPGSLRGPGGDGGDGGGFYVRHFAPHATAHIEGSLLHNNRAGNGFSGGSSSGTGTGQNGGAGGRGGGLFVVGDAGSVWQMRNTTLYLNRAGDGGAGGDGSGGGGGAGGDAGNGGGIAFGREGDDYTAVLAHLSIVSNLAGFPGRGGDPGGSDGTDSSGGGIWEVSGGIASGSGVTLANSIVALNSADTHVNVDAFVPAGRNFVAGDPRLGPLADNGGPTQTLAPLAGSPTVNTGGALPVPLAKDQRGRPRPLNGAPDLGAFEARFQIDARIGTKADPATHRIDNFYTPSGVGQTLAVRLQNMRRSRFYLSAQNDGEFTDNLRLAGTRANKTLRLDIFRLTGGGGNVTGQVAAGHTMPGVAPGGTMLFRVDVKARTKKRRAKQALFYNLTGSTAGPADCVRANITQKVKKKAKPKKR